MRTAAWVLVVLAACGGPDDAVPADAGPEADAAPIDPFVGRYDDGADFPRAGCVPGALAGFDRVDLWLRLGLRTEVARGALVTYRGSFAGDVVVPHTLTADDLLLRTVLLDARQLDAIDVCAVDADGTLRGTRASCVQVSTGDVFCNEEAFAAAPFRPRAGEPEAAHLTKLGELAGVPRWPDATYNVRVDGDLAVLARGADGIRLVDLGDPAHPVERGHFVGDADYVNDVKLLAARGRRFAITASNVSRVIDITDPRLPFLVAELPVAAHTNFLDGTTAYFATGGSGGVSAFDLANPAAPRRLGRFDRPGLGVHDLYVEGGIAYLSAIFDGMIVVDFRDPLHPVELGHEDLTGQPRRYWHSPWVTHLGGRTVIVHGDEGGDGGLRLLDGDPASPTFLEPLGAWAARPDVSVHNVMAVGTRAYLAHYRDGLRVFDLTDPNAPAVIAHFNTWVLGTPDASFFAGALGLDLDFARRRVYVADSFRGLVILSGDATVFP